ncbi:hypothetical protein ALC53_07197 [Atta colombica]|uniref:Uncharacterized protein n=1 Tax=Atta colombica TaxID=520822 RepID=A0A195BDW9_9HYME|nr:hypothetical protein ALC53_07197 [Atta colombica]
MRKGLIKILIKDVDKDISEKEIMKFIESKYEVLNIRKFNRRNKNLVTQDANCKGEHISTDRSCLSGAALRKSSSDRQWSHDESMKHDENLDPANLLLEWQTFLNSVIKNKFGNKFLIDGDLNAHHFWGINHNCHNGNIIYNFADPDQFVILNNDILLSKQIYVAINVALLTKRKNSDNGQNNKNNNLGGRLSLQYKFSREEFLEYKKLEAQFYQVEYKSQLNTINVDPISNVEIKEVCNANIKFSQIFQDRLSDRTVIFTDRSKTDNDSRSTEVIALLTVLKHINISEHINFTIFSDSKSTLSSLQNIHKLKHQSHIIQELIWISAHRTKRAASKGDLLIVEVFYITNIFKIQCNKNNEDFLKYRANVLYKGTEYFQLYYSQSGNLSSLSILERKNTIRCASFGYIVISTSSIGSCKTTNVCKMAVF